MSLFQYRKKAFLFGLVFSLNLYAVSCPAAGSTPMAVPAAPAQNASSIISPDKESADSRQVELRQIRGMVFVQKQGSGDFQVVQSDTALSSGDCLKTERGSCQLSIDGKADLFVSPHTLLKISEILTNAKDKTYKAKLSLDNGKLMAKLAQLKKGSAFEIQTPTAIAAVRGTIFYLNVANLSGKGATQIYVDETHGGVFFKNLLSGQSFMIPAFSLSTAFSDGSLRDPQKLSTEQKDAFKKNWDNPGSNPSQQFGIEEISTVPPGGGNAQNPPLETGNIGTGDADQDRISEQNIAGANGFTPPTEASPTPEASPSPATIDEQEIAMIRNEIARIREDQDFDHADANLAQISDAQTGKVFTDVFGNRVRTDQYIFHEDGSDTVQLLSLTARTGGYQNGVSSVLFGAQFNRSFGSEVEIRSLPWGDYMHIVRKDDVAANMDIDPDTEEYDELYDQYILHEHQPELTTGESALYPVHFFAQFTNPVGDRAGSDLVRFDDFYSEPFTLELETGDGVQDFTAQGIEAETILIDPVAGSTVFVFQSYLTGQSTITIDSGNSEPLIGYSDRRDSGSQTTDFAENFDASKLMDINYYRNLPVNSDGDPDNDEHPAYFDKLLNPRLDAENHVIGENHLIGGFIPIDDAGHIIDQPGFALQGVRDLVNPNPLVNGGNYNLEVILLYGYVDQSSDQEIFHEDFRIDTIITPEIFQSYGAGQDSSPSLFPRVLYPDNDDSDSNFPD